MRLQAPTLVSLVAFAAASPLTLHERSASCRSLLAKAGELDASFKSPASYCSSLLQIPAVTSTTTTAKTITVKSTPTVCPTTFSFTPDIFAASSEIALTATGVPINKKCKEHHPDQAILERTAAPTTMTVHMLQVRDAAKAVTTETILPLPMPTELASSACSCLHLATPTVVSTKTITKTITKSIPAITGVPQPKGCKVINVNGFVYNNYFSGCGRTENYNNPGNTGPSRYAAFTNTFDGSMSECDAVQACAKAAYLQLFVHYSFDLHYRRSTGRWECVQYFDSNHDHKQFHIEDNDVGAAYGYSIH